MKRLSFSLLFLSSLVIFSCKNKNSENNEETTSEDTEMNAMEEQDNNDTETKEITVAMESKSDSNLSGEVIFIEENGEVTMKATITGLPEGEHAIHIHEKADCSAADGSSAGGHWNPTYEQHGKWGDPEGYHKGDIGNFKVDENGNGSIGMTTDEWCIDCGDEEKDIVGKAIIVHDGVDDYTSQPSGDAGSRVGCGGVIEL